MDKPEILSAEEANILVEKNITGKKNQEFVKGIIDGYEARIAEARKELLDTIRNLSYKTCGYDCRRCLPMTEPTCKWLTEQLKQKGG